MARSIQVICTLITLIIALQNVDARTVQLNESNWEDITRGKTLFLKFCSKSCSHCQEMKIAWEVLEEEWEKNQDAIIGTIDCDVDTKMCQEFKINGTPTILYGDRNDLQEYAGDKSFAKMHKFAKQVLVPTCSPENYDACDGVDRERIQSWVAMSLGDVEAMIQKWENEEINAKKTFDSEMAKLQAIYDDMNNSHVLTKASLQKNLKLLQGILAQKK